MNLLGVHASELSVAALPVHRVCIASHLTFPAVETLCTGKPATQQLGRIGKVQSAKLIMQHPLQDFPVYRTACVRASPLPARAPPHNGSSRMHLAQTRGCVPFPPLLARSRGTLPRASLVSIPPAASIASPKRTACAWPRRCQRARPGTTALAACTSPKIVAAHFFRHCLPEAVARFLLLASIPPSSCQCSIAMSTAAAASGEQLLAWVRAALAQAEARTGLPGFVAVKGRRKQMVKHLGHAVAQLLSKSARVSRRPEAASALFAAPPPTRCSSHARRPAADSPHTPKKLIATPMGVCLAPPRCAVTASAPANEQSLCSAAGGLTVRFASRAWSTNTRVHETCTSACGAATVARDCA